MLDHDRQGFLDPELANARKRAAIGIVGLSGGGSHIAQQLAHNGFENFVLYDPKVVEEKHRRRLIGFMHSDVRNGIHKVRVAERVIKGVIGSARVRRFETDWRLWPDPLKSCDIVFGAVDTLLGRRDLEAFTRRYMIPLIDIGMAVDRLPNGDHRVGGQVILSKPECPCMWCMQFLRQELLNKEGSEYGDAGGHPQVVNVNAILAGAATWMAIDLLTAKTGVVQRSSFLSYDGNSNTLSVHPRWKYVASLECKHYPDSDLGDSQAHALPSSGRPSRTCENQAAHSSSVPQIPKPALN